MTKRGTFAILPILCALSTLEAARAPIEIKLATLVPDGSVWHQALKQMGSDWKTATQGRVALVVYAGGSQGDETAMIRLMRFDQLQAASLTVIGLQTVDDAYDVFSIPLFYESLDELVFVMNKLDPVLRSRLEQKGFVLLSWGYAGWVHAFSRKPIATLDELKRAKLFTSAGAGDRMAQWYKKQGFNPVQLTVGDMTVQLQTGNLDVVPSTPLAVLAFQWFRQVPFMMDLGIAPLPGATVMTKKAWDRLSADDRAKLLEAGVKMQKYLQAEIPKQDAKAVISMEKRGLKRVAIKGTPAAAAFEAAAKTYADSMRAEWVPPDIFDQAVRERDAYRKQRGATK